MKAAGNEQKMNMPVLNDRMLRGRREIMAFLKIRSWNTVRKYRRHYGLPVRIWPNDRPIAFQSELILWAIRFNEIIAEQKGNRK